jgi:tetratricopeptide (TPR) repeat protein
VAAADQPVLAQADDVPLVAQKPADAQAGDAPLAEMPQPTEDELSDSMAFASQGEVDFKAGNYRQAARNWRHSLVDDARNGAVVMLLGQSLFAMGQYDEAAGAVQQGLRMLPDDKWGVVVENYKELYPNQGLYTKHLRALEDARDAKPDSPSLRFLLGYHYAYLGYPQQALRELDKGIALAPKDEMAQKLREKQAGKSAPNESPVPRGGAAKEGAKAAAEEEGPALP